MIQPPLISVVIPTCRRPDLLSQCLRRLAPGTQSLPADRYETIVSDDGEPTVAELLAAEFPWAKWLAGPRRGPAANRNNGARHAAGEWVVFIDDDCLPEPALLSAYAAAINGDIRVYEGKTTCAAGITSPIMHAPVNLTGGWLWSCNFMISRVLFERLGGFDERFRFPHLEDVDFRDRLAAANERFVFVPEAAVDHPPRQLASGWRLAQMRESDLYYWRKRNCRGCCTLHTLHNMLRSHISRIKRFPLQRDTLTALGMAVVDFCAGGIRLAIAEATQHRPTK